jgi:biopolymer transport protein ExbD
MRRAAVARDDTRPIQPVAPAVQPPDRPRNDRQVVIAIDANRRMAINQRDVTIDDLEARLRATFEGRSDKTLFIMGAPTLRYGAIVSVIDAAKGAGVSRVGIITEGMRAQAARTRT